MAEDCIELFENKDVVTTRMLAHVPDFFKAALKLVKSKGRYAEAGTRVLSNAATGIMLDIKNADQPEAWFDVTDSRVMPPATGTMHIILAVTDHGTPRLTRYKRIIVNVEEQP